MADPFCSKAPISAFSIGIDSTLSMVLAHGGSGDLGPLHVNVWNAIIESVTCKHTIIYRSHLLPVLFTKLLFVLSDDQTWFQVASQTSISSWKYEITSFPTTSGWRHEYCISAFHKVATTSAL